MRSRLGQREKSSGGHQRPGYGLQEGGQPDGQGGQDCPGRPPGKHPLKQQAQGVPKCVDWRRPEKTGGAAAGAVACAAVSRASCNWERAMADAKGDPPCKAKGAAVDKLSVVSDPAPVAPASTGGVMFGT